MEYTGHPQCCRQNWPQQNGDFHGPVALHEGLWPRLKGLLLLEHSSPFPAWHKGSSSTRRVTAHSPDNCEGLMRLLMTDA